MGSEVKAGCFKETTVLSTCTFPWRQCFLFTGLFQQVVQTWKGMFSSRLLTVTRVSCHSSRKLCCFETAVQWSSWRTSFCIWSVCNLLNPPFISLFFPAQLHLKLICFTTEQVLSHHDSYEFKLKYLRFRFSDNLCRILMTPAQEWRLNMNSFKWESREAVCQAKNQQARVSRCPWKCRVDNQL